MNVYLFARFHGVITVINFSGVNAGAPYSSGPVNVSVREISTNVRRVDAASAVHANDDIITMLC